MKALRPWNDPTKMEHNVDQGPAKWNFALLHETRLGQKEWRCIHETKPWYMEQGGPLCRTRLCHTNEDSATWNKALPHPPRSYHIEQGSFHTDQDPKPQWTKVCHMERNRKATERTLPHEEHFESHWRIPDSYCSSAIRFSQDNSRLLNHFPLQTGVCIARNPSNILRTWWTESSKLQSSHGWTLHKSKCQFCSGLKALPHHAKGMYKLRVMTNLTNGFMSAVRG